MTQQAPRQVPKRPRPSQQGQVSQTPQYTPPTPYPPQYQQMPQQAPLPQAKGSNPLLSGLKWLFWPFLKVGGWILGLFNVIIHEILRSAVRMVFSLILSVIVIAISAAYVMALMQTNYNFSEAFPRMIQNIMGLFGM